MQTLNNQNQNKLSFIITAGLAALAGPAAGQPTGPDQPGPLQAGPQQAGPLPEREQLIGDPWGARTWLADRGVSLDGVWTADLSRNLSGGVAASGSFRHLLDFAVTWDLQPLLGVEGGTFFADLQTQNGENGSDDTGDLQAYSNIDADHFTALYEVWYQQVLLDGVLRIKAGKIDANADFAFVDNGGEFIHSSPGFSPTISVLPTYPDPAFGLLGFVGEGGGLYGGAGVFDGALQEGVSTGTRGQATLFGPPADLFVIGEVGYAWGGVANEGSSGLAGVGGLAGRLAGGVWHHTGGFARFDGGVDDGTTGFYLVFDQQLYKETDGPDDAQGLALFAQYGYADAEVSAVEHHVGAGVQWVGPIQTRDDDVTGLMVSYAGLSGEAGAGFTEDAETAIELFYKAQLTPRLSLKPDLQYIVAPGGGGLDDAWVATLRVELVF